jgi:hypothetical protein
MMLNRSTARGAGALILLLGAWAGVAPFVGPLFGYRMDTLGAWAWSTPRAELSVGPAVVALLGGLLLLTAGPRALRRFGGLMAGVAGAWLVVGTSFFPIWGGALPAAPSTGLGGLGPNLLHAVEGVGFFSGTGVLIVALAAHSLGVLSPASTRRGAMEPAMELRGAAVPATSPPAVAAAVSPGTPPAPPATSPPAPRVASTGAPSVPAAEGR